MFVIYIISEEIETKLTEHTEEMNKMITNLKQGCQEVVASAGKSIKCSQIITIIFIIIR